MDRIKKSGVRPQFQKAAAGFRGGVTIFVTSDNFCLSPDDGHFQVFFEKLCQKVSLLEKGVFWLCLLIGRSQVFKWLACDVHII